MTFSNREIAVGAWLLVFVAFWLSNAEVRRSLADLIKFVLSRWILTPMLLMGFYMIGMVYVFHEIHLWDRSLLKDTLEWFILGGVAPLFRTATDRSSAVFRQIIRDNLKVLVILEFLINTYVFSLWVELFLVPLLSSLGMMLVVAESRVEYKPMGKVLSWLSAAIGWTVLLVALHKAIADYHSLLGAETVHGVLLVPLLSVGAIPFMYAFALVVKYNDLFGSIQAWRDKDTAVVRYARRRLMKINGMSITRVERCTKAIGIDLRRAQSRQDIDEAVWKFSAPVRVTPPRPTVGGGAG